LASDGVTLEGIVESALGRGFFKVATPCINGTFNYILCTLSGKIRKHNIKIVEGDSVTIEVNPYDMTKGRIVYRKR
jgi:translation initiation factor IF-1